VPEGSFVSKPTWWNTQGWSGTSAFFGLARAPYREVFAMNHKTTTLLAIALLAGLPLRVMAGSINLGTAGDFAVLAGSAVMNTGPTVINGGDVGVYPGSAITGLPPGSVASPYSMQEGPVNAFELQAQNDLTTAYNQAAGLAVTQSLTGQNLGGLTLTPGVYFFSSSAQLTGTLTLNDQGDPNALFVFQVGSTLTTASNSSVVTENGGSMPGCDVFWQIGSSATLGTGTAFEGHILALTSITMTTGATILDGSALAQNGAVTLDSNSITNCVYNADEGTSGPGSPGPGGPGGTTVPLPNSAALGLMLLPFACLLRRVHTVVR
jgi:ice-binding like protein